jgi:hypothetical protein
MNIDNKFDYCSDNELLDLWSKSKLNSLTRLFIFKELNKRNKLYLLEQLPNHKSYYNELIYAKFKQGYLIFGGISSQKGIFLYLCCVFFLSASLYLIKYLFPDCVNHSNCVNANIYIISLLVLLFLMITLILFFDLYMTSYILITNKSIIFYKRLFLFFNVTLYKIEFNNKTSLISSIEWDFPLPFPLSFNNKSSSIIIRCRLYLFDDVYKNFNYTLNCNLMAIYNEWIRILSVKNNFKIYIPSLDGLFALATDHNPIDDSSDFINYLNILRDIKKSHLIEYSNKFKNLLYLSNYLHLTYDAITNDVKYNKGRALAGAEPVALIFPNKSLSGFTKSTLLFTNKRLIEVDKNITKIISSYLLLDIKLSFKTVIFGVAIYYNNIFKFLIYRNHINVPLLDFVQFLRSNEL